MDNSTNQEHNCMNVRHRLFGVAISTLLGLSAYALTAQEIDDSDEVITADQASTTSDTTDVLEAELDADQFTKEFLEDSTKEEFTEYMLNWHQYSKNDQDALLKEYQRRCSDDSKGSSSDLCPDEIEPSWGDTVAVTEQNALDSNEEVDESQQMPELEEETVEVRVAQPNESTENVTDPRRNNKGSEQKSSIIPTWRNK